MVIRNPSQFGQRSSIDNLSGITASKLLQFGQEAYTSSPESSDDDPEPWENHCTNMG